MDPVCFDTSILYAFSTLAVAVVAVLTSVKPAFASFVFFSPGNPSALTYHHWPIPADKASYIVLLSPEGLDWSSWRAPASSLILCHIHLGITEQCAGPCISPVQIPEPAFMTATLAVLIAAVMAATPATAAFFIMFSPLKNRLHLSWYR